MTDFQPFSSKKFVKKINLRVRFYQLKIAFFWVFKNGDIGYKKWNISSTKVE